MDNGKNNDVDISTIFFDLDNTLISTRKADKLTCTKLTQILWQKWAIPLDNSSFSCKSYLRSFKKCPENVSTNLETWRRCLWSQALGGQYNRLAGEIYEAWLKLRYEYLALTPDVEALLHRLRKHYLLGLITNGTSRAQWEKIEKLQLHSYFDVILVSGDLPWEKPHYEIFQEACNYLGVKPSQCMMVGDKLETDILGGIEAKLGATVWIPLNNQQLGPHDPNPDFIIRHVTELLNILPRNPKTLKIRNKTKKRFLPDLEDSNSNSSDGS